MTTNGNGHRPGFALTGEFLSVRPGKPWTDRDGGLREPINVAVLVGERVVKVEYRDEDSAAAAVGVAEKGDMVMLPVFVRAKGKDWLSVSGLNLRGEVE
jgi:hypothetical protein